MDTHSLHQVWTNSKFTYQVWTNSKFTLGMDTHSLHQVWTTSKVYTRYGHPQFTLGSGKLKVYIRCGHPVYTRYGQTLKFYTRYGQTQIGMDKLKFTLDKFTLCIDKLKSLHQVWTNSEFTLGMNKLLFSLGMDTHSLHLTWTKSQ